MLYRYCRCLVASFLSLLANLSAESILHLNTALERAYCSSATLSVAFSEIGIRQSEAYQMSLLPNPLLSIDTFNPDGFASKRNCDREINVTLTQFVELGGKRGLRQREAASQISLALLELEAAQLDISLAVRRAFIETMAAQEYLKAATEQQRIAQEICAAITSQEHVGKVGLLEAKKAEVICATAQRTLNKSQRTFEIFKKKLAALWGSDCPDFNEVSYPLLHVSCLPSLTEFNTRQANNPDLAKWNVKIMAAKQIVALEKAQRVPDIDISAGYENDWCGSSWTLGVAVPLPIFDRNQGNIGRAQKELYQLYEIQRDASLKLKIEIAVTYEDLLSAYYDVVAFKNSIRPTASAAFNGAKESFFQGKQNYLELLDAQRTLFEVEEQYIDALTEYHQKKTDLHRLIGAYSHVF